MTAPAHGPADDEAPLTPDERAELVWLRTENTLLRVERDILLRVASGYARDMHSDSHHRTPPPGP